MRLALHLDEGVVEYMRRRNRQATLLMNQHSRWTTKHRQRVIAWSERLQRPRDQNSWPAMLLKFRDAEWFGQQQAMKTAHVPVLFQVLSRCAGMMGSSWPPEICQIDPLASSIHILVSSRFSIVKIYLGCYRPICICI